MPYEKIICDRPYEANKCIWNQSQISKMELFVEIANDWKRLNIFQNAQYLMFDRAVNISAYFSVPGFHC